MKGKAMASNPRDRLWPPNKFLCRLAASIGIVCCSILSISSVIGIFRGYSVQSMIIWFLPWIIPTWISFNSSRKDSFIQGLKDSCKPSMENLFFAIFLVYVCIGLLQGRHYYKGSDFYNQGQYDKAAAEFEKETRLWYLRLNYNMSEDQAMQGLAESYCQLEQYDKAIGVYELIISRYSGAYREGASLDLQRLKDGLQAIAQYKEENQGLQNDFSKLYDIAHVYESDLNCNRKALDIYETITQMNIAEKDKRDAYDAILRLTPVELLQRSR
jgi:tetratricopeptide (TPR) repeat protein